MLGTFIVCYRISRYIIINHTSHIIYTSHVIRHTSYIILLHHTSCSDLCNHIGSCSVIFIYICILYSYIYWQFKHSGIHKFLHNSVSFSIHRWSDHSPARRWHSWHDWQRATGPSDNYGLSRIARHFEIEVRCTRNQTSFFRMQIVQFTPINQKCRGFSWILMIRKGKRNVHQHSSLALFPTIGSPAGSLAAFL